MLFGFNPNTSLGALFVSIAQKGQDTGQNPFKIAQLALPYHQDVPTGPANGSDRAPVTSFINGNLGLPVLQSALGQTAPTAAVAMPEASVNENGFFQSGKGDIRLAWELAIVRPIPVAKSMQRLPQQKLGTGVARSDARHDLAALLRSHEVSHIAKVQF